MTRRIFTDEEQTIDHDSPLPPRKGAQIERTGDPNTDQALERKTRYSELLPYGTDISPSWSEIWVTHVAEVERSAGYAICGSRLRETEVEQMIRGERLTREESESDPLSVVCRFTAGLNTAHPGAGRCHRHGGNTDPSAKFSLLSHSSLSPRVREFFESEALLDLRGAIGVVWAAADALMGDGEDEDDISTRMSSADAASLGALMTRIGNLTKQHNEIMEKRKITIEVPEFIAWAEHFYELAIRHIMDGEKDVQAFLQEAQSYYNATVTLTVGLTPTGNRNSEVNPFGSNSTPEVLRSGESER